MMACFGRPYVGLGLPQQNLAAVKGLLKPSAALRRIHVQNKDVLEMGELKHNWLTDYIVDFEYKQYVLLAYLQKVKKSFGELCLFPELSDLIYHYRNLMHYIESKELIDENLPAEVNGLDMEKMKLVYQRLMEDDQMMEVLNELVDYALPQFEDAIYEGREIYEIVEEHIRMESVGIVPLYNKEGYFVLTDEDNDEATVYRYDLSSIEKPDESFRTISSSLVKKVKKSKYEGFESLKLELISEHRELPVPAIYRFHSTLEVPHSQTFLPITKRILLKELLAA